MNRGQEEYFHVLVVGTQVQVGTVLVEIGAAVQIPRLEKVGRRVRAEDRRGKQVVAEDPQIRRPRCDPMLPAFQSCGFALPRKSSNNQPDGDVSGGKWRNTRYWPSSRDSRLSAMISGGHSGGSKRDILDARGRASLNVFLLWLFENAGCVVDLASTTRRLGPGRGGTVSGSYSKEH